MQGFVSNIEKDTVDNENFRKVLYTGKNTQLVLMNLKPKENIGQEIHEDTDQFFRVETGKGQAIINGETQNISDGFSVLIPAGTKHDIINVSHTEPLKLYTLYSPPHHRDGVIHETKAQAETDNEHFDGKTTETVGDKKALSNLIKRVAEYVWKETEKDPNIKTLIYKVP